MRFLSPRVTACVMKAAHTIIVETLFLSLSLLLLTAAASATVVYFTACRRVHNDGRSTQWRTSLPPRRQPCTYRRRRPPPRRVVRAGIAAARDAAVQDLLSLLLQLLPAAVTSSADAVSVTTFRLLRNDGRPNRCHGRLRKRSAHTYMRFRIAPGESTGSPMSVIDTKKPTANKSGCGKRN